MLSKLY